LHPTLGPAAEGHGTFDTWRLSFVGKDTLPDEFVLNGLDLANGILSFLEKVGRA